MGAKVTRFKAGDNVAMLGDGRFRDLTRVKEAQAALLPAVIDDWSEWVIEPIACAVNGVDVANIRIDDAVGVVGLGYMGQLVTRTLAVTPVRSIAAFDIQPDALERAIESGADFAIRADQDVDEIERELEAKIFRRPMPESYVLPGLQNGPLDVVFETSGSAAGLRLASRLVRVGGMVIMFGHQRGLIEIDGTEWHLKGIHVVNGSPMSAENFHQMFYRAAAMVSAGRIKLGGLVTHSRPAAQAQEVFDASGKPGYVKGSVTFGDIAGVNS
nr:zinc-binding dehydrogenase [Arthrobacter sp. Soil762]